MNALRKTAEQKVSSIASKQVAKPRRSKDQHAMAMLIQRRGRTSRTRLSGRGGPFSERRKLGWDYSGRSISLRAHRAIRLTRRQRTPLPVALSPHPRNALRICNAARLPVTTHRSS